MDRDGSPVREFAFWLRDLRNRSGLTYAQLARTANRATSTIQDAASGRRLPTIRVLRSFVLACHGDLPAWEAYWRQIKRLADGDGTGAAAGPVTPPWADGLAGGSGPAGGPGPAPPSDGWYVESLRVLVRFDVVPAEVVEQRLVIAAQDGLLRLGEPGFERQAGVELLHGGALEQRTEPGGTAPVNVVTLARPLRAGERHEYALRCSLPPAGRAGHLLHVPVRRCDRCDLRLRFAADRVPGRVWRLAGVSPAARWGSVPPGAVVVPDRFGEVKITFSDLAPGLGYGAAWRSAVYGDRNR
jgi:hypothetical protein